MTVLDNIKLGGHTQLQTNVWQALRYFGAAQAELELRREIEEQVIDFLEMVHPQIPITMLPYGLQKVELGRAGDARVLLLDEPVAGMNREETADMARFILDVQEQFGTTILLVEHDMHMVMDITSRIVVLNFDNQIASGTPRRYQQPAVIEAIWGPQHDDFFEEIGPGLKFGLRTKALMGQFVQFDQRADGRASALIAVGIVVGWVVNFAHGYLIMFGPISISPSP